jgi:hypothetical protein
MKSMQSIKKILPKHMTRKSLVLSGIILCLSITGATSYALYQQKVAKAPVIVNAPNHSLQESPATSKSEGVPPPSDAVPSESPRVDSSNTTSQPSKPTPQAVSPPTSTPPPSSSGRVPIPTQEAIVFSAGRLQASIACYTGTYTYLLNSASVSVNTKTSQSFSWRIELSNGSIHQQGSSYIPYGTTVWQDFPSTAGFPSTFGQIYNPPDGLSARFVITAPNYSAGSWSDPVPIGSGSSCHAASL